MTNASVDSYFGIFGMLPNTFLNLIISQQSKKESDQESIQSSTTPDPGYQWESDNFTLRHYKREPRGQPSDFSCFSPDVSKPGIIEIKSLYLSLTLGARGVFIISPLICFCYENTLTPPPFVSQQIVTCTPSALLLSCNL